MSSDQDWRRAGSNIAEWIYHMGVSVEDARMVLLGAWEGWTSGEPEREDVIFEMLATWKAMVDLSGLDDVNPLLEELSFALLGPEKTEAA